MRATAGTVGLSNWRWQKLKLQGPKGGLGSALLGHVLGYMCGADPQHLTPTFIASLPKRLCRVLAASLRELS